MTNKQEAIDFLNSLYTSIVGRMPRYRYWQVKGDHYAFCYTTEPCANGKFYATVYRITQKAWKLTRKIAFGRRKIAKKRAYHWYCQRKEKLTKKEEA